jgi:precorrin-6Y C5,15-methyltransferase (decarboxylating)
MSRNRTIAVVGIGADGWAGLPAPSRDELCAAEVVLGAARQLRLLPDTVPGRREAWPSPLLPALPGLLAGHAGRRVCVLASGDPMFFGIGSVLVGLLGAERVRVLPHVSSVSLACARLGWGVQDVEVVSLVGREPDTLRRALSPGRRLLVLTPDGTGPGTVRNLLADAGFGPSELTVLERLGAPDERVGAPGVGGDVDLDPLNLVAVRCVADPGAVPLATVPGLPDDAYEHDGQLTKRDLRAAALARLVPLPGQLLWDLGAGAGSVGIEWMRAHPSCRAVAVEADPERAARIARNAARLGVPGLEVVTGHAPQVLPDAAPDAVFVGGGATAPGLLEACWDRLGCGGRLVVHAVTVESEAVLARWHAERGGELIRIAVQRAEPVGRFTGWRAAMPVTQWSCTRPT